MFITEHILIVHSCFKTYHLILLRMVKEISIFKWGMKTNFKCFFPILLIQDVIQNIRHGDKLKFKALKKCTRGQGSGQHEKIFCSSHCILSSIPKDLYLLLKSCCYSWILPFFLGQPIYFVLNLALFYLFHFQENQRNF